MTGAAVVVGPGYLNQTDTLEPNLISKGDGEEGCNGCNEVQQADERVAMAGRSISNTPESPGPWHFDGNC